MTTDTSLIGKSTGCSERDDSRGRTRIRKLHGLAHQFDGLGSHVRGPEFVAGHLSKEQWAQQLSTLRRLRHNERQAPSDSGHLSITM